MADIACLESAYHSGQRERGIFIGVRPSKSAGETDFGHLWLVLSNDVGACGGDACQTAGVNNAMNQPTERWIGYYPELPVLPPEISEAPLASKVKAFFQYFIDNHVPGVKRVDDRAYLLATRFPERVIWIGVFGQEKTFAVTLKSTAISSGDSEIVGRYGLDTSVPGVNNCVSWAIDVAVNPALPAESQFIVDNPPKVRSFIGHPENTRCRLAESVGSGLS